VARSAGVVNTKRLSTKGGIALFKPAFLYNLGRVISYTSIGFIVGALGSVMVFSGELHGALKLAAGVLMVIMGINMLGILPQLSRIVPRMPRALAQRIESEKLAGKGPLFVGLLNGLMPCGPLQAMQLYALSTANPFAGALAMLFFGLGTVPLMFGLGALASALGRVFTKKVMTVGAVLVVVLGMSMFSQGWNLSGLAAPSTLFAGTGAQQQAGIGGQVGADGQAGAEGQATVVNGVQQVNSTLASGRYPNITVQAGTPVKWAIDAPQGSINGCNNRMILREYGIEHAFKTGENIIEFTPTDPGTFQYSCWMGMIRGTIDVI
jgi:sulfite exporter TauE/SafE